MTTPEEFPLNVWVYVTETGAFRLDTGEEAPVSHHGIAPRRYVLADPAEALIGNGKPNAFDRILEWDSGERLFGRYPSWRLARPNGKAHVGALVPQKNERGETVLQIRDSTRGQRSQYQMVVRRNLDPAEHGVRLEVRMPGKHRYCHVTVLIPELKEMIDR